MPQRVETHRQQSIVLAGNGIEGNDAVPATILRLAYRGDDRYASAVSTLGTITVT